MLDLRIIQGVCRRTGRGIVCRIRSMHPPGCGAEDSDERNTLCLANVVGLMGYCKLWT